MHTRVLTEKGDIIPAFGMDDRIFLGEGLFETLRVDSSRPCFALLHWQRLDYSAKTLGIPFDLSSDEWHEHLIAQIKHDNLYHGGIKAILSGGSAPRGLAEQGQVSQLIFQTFNYTIKSSPVRLLSTPWLRDAGNPVYRMKTVNYLEAIMARRQALNQGADDALFFNLQQDATETTCANFFIIKNNQLATPKLEHGVLPGITRGRILALCAQHEITCIETRLSKSMIEEADAAFITNSLQGVRYVSTLDQLEYRVNHPLVEQLISLLSFYDPEHTKNQDG